MSSVIIYLLSFGE